MLTQSKIHKEREAALASIGDLYTFVRNFWHVNNSDPFVDSKHLRYLCNELNRYGKAIASRQAIDDLIINVPPGMSKSTIVNHCFPLWIWLQNPSTVFICSCYSSGLTEEHSTKSKAIFNSERFQKWYQSYFRRRFGKEMYLTKDTVIDWTNNFNGRRYSTYTGGVVTGVHCHAFILDDPMSVEMTYYDNAIKRAHRFNDKTLPTRTKNKASTPKITVMQRLHNDDTTGHELEKVKKGKKIRHICLPAELSANVKPESARAIYTDGLLDPNRCDRNVLAAQKLELGSGQFSGQYSQVPVDELGGLIKKEWFKYEDERDIPFDIVWDQWIDGAYTDNSKDNDPSGIMIVGFHERTKKLYVKYFIDKYLEMPDLMKLVPEVFYLNGYGNKSRAFIEPKASGETLIQLINDTTKIPALRIKGHLVSEGKRARISTASPKYEAGRIIHVKGHWNESFESQLTDFPAHKHDEAVDLIGYACDYYFGASFSNLAGSSTGPQR